KAFPKVMAIMERLLASPFGVMHAISIVRYLDEYLSTLAEDEERNKYLISWISYFLVGNGLRSGLKKTPRLRDPITRTTFNNRSQIFKQHREFRLFVGCVKTRKRITLANHLNVWRPLN
ncbi:MAG TPA: hypothetical protein VFS09_03645, partial [Candidatus Eisenbacteria bacterium]|nr:hypothetical protein [Candidatus Eisenbacteria bacterium]